MAQNTLEASQPVNMAGHQTVERHKPTDEVGAEKALEAVTTSAGGLDIASEALGPVSAWDLEMANAGGDARAMTKPTESTRKRKMISA